MRLADESDEWDDPFGRDDLADEELDREFPLGDGTADSDAMVVCPHCGETVEIALDPGGGGVQTYVEDCEVCCRPWRVSVRYLGDGAAEVGVRALDD